MILSENVRVCPGPLCGNFVGTPKKNIRDISIRAYSERKLEHCHNFVIEM